MYETITFVGAFSYLPMFPTLVAIPALWKFMLQEFDEEKWTEEAKNSLESLFLLLSIVVGVNYLIAWKNNAIVIMDITVLQRIFLVSVGVGLTALLGQDAFPHHNHTCMLMTAVDVSGGIAHGLVAPGGLSGVWGKISA